MNKEILISIYPSYLRQIREGIKNFEFRPFKLDSGSEEFIYMWVYETRPIMAINTLLLVKNPIVDLEKSITGNYGLGEQEFVKNVNNNRYAYEIIKVYNLKYPILLSDMKKLGIYNAPQNYLILNKYKQLFNRLSVEKEFILNDI